MASSGEYLTRLQTDLYKERHGHGSLSKTFQSSIEHNPGLIPHRITTFPERYGLYVHNQVPQVKCPWGRARSYAGDAPVQLPLNNRPKCEPPTLLQKSHRHFGSGANPHPRLPRPSTADVQRNQIHTPFPKESSLSSHTSRQAVFPRPEPYIGYDPCVPSVSRPSTIINKAMGSFGRREIIETPRPQSSEVNEGFTLNVKPVTITSPFFNRHDIISEFNKLHPSDTPTLRLPIQRLRKADWL